MQKDDAPLPVKIVLYRVLQEALTNGFRHAQATKQRVEMHLFDDVLEVSVADNGKGFDPEFPLTNGHLGLQTMRERVEILSGTFKIESELDKGTVVRARLPINIVETDIE